MYFIQRAIKYLKRKLGKTLLLGVIFLVIANFVLAGLLVQNASNKAQTNTRLTIGSDITFSTNFDNFFEAFVKGAVSREQTRKLKSSNGLVSVEEFTIGGGPTYVNFMNVVNSEYVDTYAYKLSLGVQAKSLLAIQIDASAGESNNFLVDFYGSNSPKDFIDGVSVLVEGRFPNDDEITNGSSVVVLEENILESNRLSIGDTIELDFNIDDEEVVRISHEIIGVYKTSAVVNQYAGENQTTAFYPQNKIYTPFNVLRNIGVSQDDLDNVLIDGTLITLNDPEDLELFISEAEEKIDFNYGMLDSNDDLYNNLVGPIESLGFISNILVASIVITGGFIIGLITALTINDRKSEIGILLAVGESKFKIVSQFVLEVVLIAVIAFSVSLFTGELLGQQVSETLLDSEIFGTVEAVEESKEFGKRGMDSNKKVDTKAAEESADMDISLDFTVLIQLFSMGVVLTVVSTAIPSLYVMRFNPKQILTNRNS